MASSKKKTTFMKLARESRLRERRLEKQARKDARKRASDHHPASFGDPGAEGERTEVHAVGSIDGSASSRGED